MRGQSGREGLPMNIRIATIVIGALDAAAAGAIAVGAYNSGSDHATIGFDYAAGVIVSVLFLATGLPAVVLAWFRRAPRVALALALGFPSVFVLLFLAAVVAFSSLR
jgi:hypothetical protein